jgi:heme-degrading monooxygenase HmoA
MVIALIRTQLRPDADLTAYEQLNGQMSAIIERIPGYVSAMGYRAETGEEISLIRFASADALRAWRDHPDHQVVQRRGREEFYATYRIEICEVVRAYDFGITAPGVRTGDA